MGKLLFRRAKSRGVNDTAMVISLYRIPHMQHLVENDKFNQQAGASRDGREPFRRQIRISASASRTMAEASRSVSEISTSTPARVSRMVLRNCAHSRKVTRIWGRSFPAHRRRKTRAKISSGVGEE